ncbi:MAG: hypothetical protein FWH53_02695 [Leptospirales bacterium]|nr:hypothetical protein [Leptospirales bacterium]
MKKILYIIFIIFFAIQLISCASTGIEGVRKQTQKENEDFLKSDKDSSEVFRVLLTSDEYKVVQVKHNNSIERVSDESGDKYISNELQKLDIIDEARIGVVSVWLYPDSGRIMKIRSQRPIYFKEIDALLNDDIMRWNFKFPKKVVEPTRFDIMYRVVLSKKRSDEEIIKEVQDMMKEKY